MVRAGFAIDFFQAHILIYKGKGLNSIIVFSEFGFMAPGMYK